MKHLTYRQVELLISVMTEEQKDMTATVSAGCDENGNAEFFAVSEITVANSPLIEAAAGDVFEPNQPIILFDE
jgi:hypothetical protein